MITILGKIHFSRYILRPKRKEDAKMLWEKEQVKSVAPLDSYLGIANLPFKMTAMAMLKTAYWAQNQCSYQRAEDAIQEALHIRVNDDTVRLVTNFVGGMIFREDCRIAEQCYELLCSGQIPYQKEKDGVLYIQTDGAALNTRLKNESGSTWRENKLGEVFSTKDIHFWKDKNGRQKHRIIKKEYISYIGSAGEFKKHLLALALRGGYGHFKETVVISDGATWIRFIVEEMFPDAQHILDFFHLCENVTTYAKYIFQMDESKFRPWAEDICASLKAGKYKEVLKELSSSANKRGKDCPVNLSGYISNNIKNINYPEYESKGYFIGSGAIESGNKLVLQQRLKQAGMRWNTDSAQALLTLRSKSESNLWHSAVELPFLNYCRALSHPR